MDHDRKLVSELSTGGLSRRAVVRAGANAAWMVPVVAIASAAPALAVSTPDPPSGPSVYSNLVTPEYTDEVAQEVTLSGTIWPSVAGRQISLYKDNDYWKTATTDSSGNFVYTATITKMTTFKWYAGAQTSGGNTYEAAGSGDFTVKALYLFDDFSYTNSTQMQPKWKTRLNAGYNESTKFVHCKSNTFDAVHFEGGNMVYKITPDGTNAADGQPRYNTGHLTPNTAVLTGLKTLVYGNFEARVKFGRPAGFHAAFWVQCGYGPGGGEFDIAEFFGQRSVGSFSSQNMQHTIHKTSDGSISPHYGNTWTHKKISIGGPNSILDFSYEDFAASPSNSSTWWSQFHTFKGVWNASKYEWWVDGIKVGTIGTAQSSTMTPATIPGDIIFSQRCADTGSTPSEYDALQSFLNGGGDIKDFNMSIDYVRVWK